jgi:hypothetical protein
MQRQPRPSPRLVLPAGVAGSNPAYGGFSGYYLMVEPHTTLVISGEPGVHKQHFALGTGLIDRLHTVLGASGKLPA